MFTLVATQDGKPLAHTSHSPATAEPSPESGKNGMLLGSAGVAWSVSSPRASRWHRSRTTTTAKNIRDPSGFRAIGTIVAVSCLLILTYARHGGRPARPRHEMRPNPSVRRADKCLAAMCCKLVYALDLRQRPAMRPSGRFSPGWGASRQLADADEAGTTAKMAADMRW